MRQPNRLVPVLLCSLVVFGASGFARAGTVPFTAQLSLVVSNLAPSS